MKPILTAKQKRLIRKALDRIEAAPKRFDMTDWGRASACGTVCCFAGHLATVITRKSLEDVTVEANHYASIDGNDVRDICQKALGLTNDTDCMLVGESRWPRQFSNAYDARRTPIGKARVLRRRVEHWMETGE